MRQHEVVRLLAIRNEIKKAVAMFPEPSFVEQITANVKNLEIFELQYPIFNCLNIYDRGMIRIPNVLEFFDWRDACGFDCASRGSFETNSG